MFTRQFSLYPEPNRQPEHSAYGQEERKKLAFQSAYMWRLVGLLKSAQIILNLSFAVSSSIYLPCFYTTGGFIEATAWITFVLICFSFLVDAFGSFQLSISNIVHWYDRARPEVCHKLLKSNKIILYFHGDKRVNFRHFQKSLGIQIVRTKISDKNKFALVPINVCLIVNRC